MLRLCGEVRRYADLIQEMYNRTDLIVTSGCEADLKLKRLLSDGKKSLTELRGAYKHVEDPYQHVCHQMK